VPLEIPDKRYFKIGEAASLVGVKAHVLRYWEGEFRGVRPSKTKSGQRLFRQQDIELLYLIRLLLYEHRFKLAGVKLMLKELSEESVPWTQAIEELERGGVSFAASLAAASEESTQRVLNLETGASAAADVVSSPSEEVTELQEANRALRTELNQASDEALHRVEVAQAQLDELKGQLTQACDARNQAEATATLASMRAQAAEARLAAFAEETREQLEKAKATMARNDELLKARTLQIRTLQRERESILSQLRELKGRHRHVRTRARQVLHAMGNIDEGAQDVMTDRHSDGVLPTLGRSAENVVVGASSEQRRAEHPQKKS